MAVAASAASASLPPRAPVAAAKPDGPPVKYYNFRQPCDLIALFTSPQHNHAFMNAWLAHLQAYFTQLRAHPLEHRAFGLGEQFLGALQVVLDAPCWEHKLLCILVYIMSTTQARASLREADHCYMRDFFRPQMDMILWGRAPNGQMIGSQSNHVQDTSRVVLRSFVQDQVQLYLFHGFDLA
jgi:hypothetical protein